MQCWIVSRVIVFQKSILQYQVKGNWVTLDSLCHSVVVTCLGVKRHYKLWYSRRVEQQTIYPHSDENGQKYRKYSISELGHKSKPGPEVSSRVCYHSALAQLASEVVPTLRGIRTFAEIVITTVTIPQTSQPKEIFGKSMPVSGGCIK